MKTKTVLIISLFLLLFSCGPAKKSAMQTQPKTLTAKEKWHKSVYYLQHRILPDWTYNSDGKFYKELLTGDSKSLRGITTDLLSSQYAEALKIEHRPEAKGVLITFPKPQEAPECYFAFIISIGNKYKYYTYEKTFQLEGSDVSAMVCSWTKEGHLNHGGRTYTTADEFVADIAKMSKE